MLGPPLFSSSVRFRFRSHAPPEPGGDEGIRTPDLCFAKAALSQLSYIPFKQPSRQLAAVSLVPRTLRPPADS